MFKWLCRNSGAEVYPRAIIHRLDLILANQRRIMATLDEILQDVTDESTAIDGVLTLISGLKAQLDAALAGAGITPEVQSKIDAIFTAAEANKAKLATALAANTPPPAT